MSHTLSHIFTRFNNFQLCQRGILLFLLLYLLRPALSTSIVTKTVKGQSEHAESPIDQRQNSESHLDTGGLTLVYAVHLPVIFRNATLTVLPSAPLLTPTVSPSPTGALPSTILPTTSMTLSNPLLEDTEATATPTPAATVTTAATPTPTATFSGDSLTPTASPAMPLPTATPTVPPTSTPVHPLLPTATPTVPPTSTPVNPLLPTATPTVANTPAPVATVVTTPGGANATLIYTSSNGDGTVGGIAFNDEDILSYNMTTGVWALVFDGSDVGITGDVEALHVESDGSLLLSLENTAKIPGFGAVEDEDIVRFIPTSLGATTAGSFAWFFDGSDVGLDSDEEDIDAFTRLPDGRLVISSNGAFDAGGVSGLNQDLFVFTPSSLGETTNGAWAIYFDGSDVDMTYVNEDIWGVDVAANGDIYLSTNYTYAVPGLSGDSNDIFVCTPTSLGDTTSCTFSLYWDGDNYGFGSYWLDVLAISDVTLVGSAPAKRTTVETTVTGNQLYLPLINR
ncbi:MAG: hypothetical protein DYG89_54065 [Caldilinea sp. CFX5]|nr:hypothetical protein [Caldilinea sp. CFX5]